MKYLSVNYDGYVFQVPVDESVDTSEKEALVAQQFMATRPRPKSDTPTLVQFNEQDKAKATYKKAATVNPKAQYSTLDVAANEARKGLTGVADLGNAILAGSDKLGSLVGLPPIMGGYDERKKGIDGFRESVTGVNPVIVPRSSTEKVLGGALSAASDPTNLLSAGSGSIIGNLFKGELTRAASMTAGRAALGGAAGAGAAGGVNMAESAGVENPVLKGVAGLTGGVGTAGALSLAPTRVAATVASQGLELRRLAMTYKNAPTPELKQQALEALQAHSRISGQSVEQLMATAENAAGAMAAGRTEHLVRQAVATDPQLASKVDNAQQLSNRLGVPLPAVAASGDNAVLRSAAEHRISTAGGASGRATHNAVVANAKEGVRSRITGTYGDPAVGSEKTVAAATGIANQLDRGVSFTKERYEGALTTLNSAIAGYSSRSTVGGSIERLVEAKERLVKSELTPQYKALEEKAIANNVELPPDATLLMKMGLESIMDRNFMTLHKPEMRMALNHLKKAADEQQPLSFADLDQIKQGLNRLNRARLEDNTKYVVGETIRNVLKPALDNLPEDFRGAYAAVDAEYLKRVGLDLSSDGMLAMDGKRLSEQVVPVLVNSPQVAGDFLKATGEDGARLLDEALRADLRRTAATSGTMLDATSLAKWGMRRADVLALAPTMREELKDSAKRLSVLQQAEAEAVARQKDFISKDLLGSTGGNIDKILTMALNDNRAMASLITRYGDNSGTGTKDVVQAVRSLALTRMLDEPGFVESLNSVTRRNEITKLFGSPKLAQDLSDISQAAPLLINNLDSAFRASQIARSEVEQQMGITIPSLISRALDRISSTPIKALNIARTVAITKADDAYGKQVEELLLTPDGLNNLAAIIRRVSTKEGGVDYEKFAEQVLKDASIMGRLKAAGRWAKVRAKAAALEAVPQSSRTSAQDSPEPPESILEGASVQLPMDGEPQ